MSKGFWRSRLLAATFLSICFCSLLQAQMVLINEDIIGDKAVLKMNLMGQELRQKSGIGVYLVALRSLEGRVMVEVEQSLELQEPYALLMLSQEEKQLNIMTSSGVERLFSKEDVLSPYPWTGTILPLLTAKKSKDNYSAALLNGYADIVEQIAKTKHIVLENAIGSTNKNTLNLVRIVVYATLAWAVLLMLYRRRKHNHARNS